MRLKSFQPLTINKTRSSLAEQASSRVVIGKKGRMVIWVSHYWNFRRLSHRGLLADPLSNGLRGNFGHVTAKVFGLSGIPHILFGIPDNPQREKV